MTAVDLATDSGRQAQFALASFTPRLTKAGYIGIIRSLARTEDYGELYVG